MATAQDVQNSERLLDLSNQLIDSINERKKALKGINAEEQLYLSSVRQQQKLSQDITANAENYLRYAVKSKDLNKQIDASRKNQKKTEDAFATIEQKLIDTRRKATIEARNINTSIIKQKQELFASEQRRADLETRKQIAISQGDRQSAQYLQDRIKDENATARIKLGEIDSLQKELDKELKLRDSAKETLKNEEKAKKTRAEELDFLEKNLEIRKRIEKSTGLLGAMTKSLSKIPGIGQYLNAEEAIEEMEKLGAEIEDAGGQSTSFGNRLKIGLKGASTLAKGFYENLKSPEAIFTLIITKALEANKQTVELGKQLGYGVGRADLLRENIAEVARNSYNMNVTAASATEAFSQLAQSTGLISEFTADQLETQIKLTKQVGLTADEAAQVQRFAVLNNKTSEETYRSFLKGITATRNQLKVGIDFKATLAEAVKVSGQLAANLGNNPETIGRAIVTAKAFGMTLEQVAKSGESLLNFESSIESELKAELLTGKQLNLERARAAALAGDQISLAEELNKNIGTSAEFTKMNVLQQKALAESVGMTADELANTLRKREEAIKSGKSLAQITEEEAAQALERQNIQEKFGAAMLKLQDIIGNLVAGPLGMLLDGLSYAFNIVNLIAEPFRLISSIINSIIPAGNTFGTILKGILFTAIGIMTFLNPIKSLLSLALLGGAIMGTKALLGDDVVSPGYGKRTLLSPEGAIKLNNNDTVIAGTNLGGGEGKGSMPSIDLTPMIAAINEVRAAVDRLYSKDQSINMDGKKVGTTLVQGSYKVA
jgi:hypothetical protein